MLVDTGELEVPGSEVHRSESEVLRGEGTIVIVTPGLSATYHVPASWSLRRRMPCVWVVGGGASNSFPLSTEARRAGKTHLSLHTLW